MDIIAGVDEVGRGPLAGPVVAAAVILNDNHPITGLTDSKKINNSRRLELAEIIHCNAIAISIGRAESYEIDQYNIREATFLAMQRAIESLSYEPTSILVDGNATPDCKYPISSIVKGDLYVPVISAASIVAKVTRDREMIEADNLYPGYGFAKNMGYPTKEHIEALSRIGITPIHRKSFRPVSILC